MILDLARQGLSVSAIARRTGLDRKTIRKYIARGLEAPAYTPRPARPTLLTPFEPYLRERLQAFPDLSARRLLRELKERGYAHAQQFPERAVRESGLGILAPYREYLEARLAEGNENAAALWRELQDRGFAGSAKQVRRWLNQRRTTPAKFTPHKWRLGPTETTSTSATGPFPALISPRQLAWRLVQAPQSIDTATTEALARISKDPEVAKGRDLVRRFAELIGRCGVRSDVRPANPSAILDTWLTDALSCGIPAVETFAAGVRQDEAAVKAALTTPWSSGQAEGQVNKLKLIKRQMYGRANFDLLRRRVLLAA